MPIYKERLAEIAAIPDEQIDTSDIPELDEAFFANARLVLPAGMSKKTVTMRMVEDVLVDLDHSSLVAVVLSVGGFLGVGDKLVAVPVNQIKVGSEAKFTTDLTKEQLANAPAFDFSKLK